MMRLKVLLMEVFTLIVLSRRASLYELAKMDGALILNETGKQDSNCKCTD